MATAPNTIETDYWDNFAVDQADLEFINNFLFELEIPQTTQELVKAVVNERITREKKNQAKQQSERGKIFAPRESYQIHDAVVFPALNWKEGVVDSIREGHNPEFGAFKVMDVVFADNETSSFAFELPEHDLNNFDPTASDSEALNADKVIEEYGELLAESLEEALLTDPDLALITGSWFPRALFVDINAGQLNLAEAILDMAGGGPMPTKELMEQLDLPADVNPVLTEFSLNLALQEDPRFDEVGAAGEVLWYLERLEPENVRNTPLCLQYQGDEVDRTNFPAQMVDLEKCLDDEFSSFVPERVKLQQAEIILTYPHWRSGTLPLTRRTRKLFPTAMESPRIRITLIDADTKAKFQGWVVRPGKYVVGLAEWYKENGIIPGSLITIHKANAQGEVVIKVEKKRVKEWLRTVLVGADGGVVYALLKQQVGTTYDERMATFTPDPAGIDAIWPRQKNVPIEKVLVNTAAEITKLNPQGHFHAQELYGAVNVIRRCPPDVIFSALLTSPAFTHVGDLYFRLAEKETEEA